MGTCCTQILMWARDACRVQRLACSELRPCVATRQPWKSKALGQVRWFTEDAAQNRPVQIRIDGRQSVQDMCAQVKDASDNFANAVQLVAHGDPSVVAALHVLATLRRTTRAPGFTLAGETTVRRATENVMRRADEAAAGAYGAQEQRRGRADSDDQRRGRAYHFDVPPAFEWLPESQRRVDSTLRVGNGTEPLGLAKAIAARAAVLEEGQAVAVETALIGEEKRRRWRASQMARALARAHHWEVFPVDESKPTRPFRCIAELVRDEVDKAERGGALDCWLLRVEVLPRGPPKWSG